MAKVRKTSDKTLEAIGGTLNELSVTNRTLKKENKELKEQRDELLKRLEETGRMLEGYISGNSTHTDKAIQLQLSENSKASGKQD